MKEHIVTGIILILEMVFVSLGFFGGYYAIQNYFAVPKAVEDFVHSYRQEGKAQEDGFVSLVQKSAELAVKTTPSPVRLDIFYVSGEQSEAVISVLDTKERTWTIYTLPGDTRVELGETAYRKLAALYPALPQMFEIGVLSSYMEKGQEARVLSTVLSDLLFCSFSSAVTCTKEELSSWCTKNDAKYCITKEMMEYMAQDPGKKQMWEKLSTQEDTSALYYAETLAMLEPRNVAEEILAGQRESDGYHLDENAARKQLSGMLMQ